MLEPMYLKRWKLWVLIQSFVLAAVKYNHNP